jgi:hypothetical protein
MVLSLIALQEQALGVTSNMKYILTPNLNPPYNLRQISLNPDLFDTMTEAEVLAHVIQRNKEVGIIPCETESERTQCLEDYQAKHIHHPKAPALVLPPIGPHYVVDDTDLPDRSNSDKDYFFDCWEWDDGCKVNMPKARGKHMDCIRLARNKELAAKDIPWMKAVEDGDTGAQATIKVEKQTLRDIPQTFDLTTDTTQQLINKWPSELPARE